MKRNKPHIIPDRVPSNLFEQYREHFDKEFSDHIAHQDFRRHVTSIIDDCTNTVSFMQKIKAYASEEIDTRMYKSIDFWVKTVLIPIGVAILTVVCLKLLKLS
jgi:hypothetical protein